MNIPNYISPENKKEVDDLMKDRKAAETKEGKQKAREDINAKVVGDTKTVKDKLN